MSVERVELGPVIRGVSQDDDSTVVERRRIVRERLNGPAERSVNRRSRVAEDVEPEVDGATFIERALRAGEERRAIEQSRLIVLTDRDAHAGLAHGGVDACRDERLRVLAWVRADERTRNAQVEYEDRFLTRIERHDRRERAVLLCEPRPDALARR